MGQDFRVPKLPEDLLDFLAKGRQLSRTRQTSITGRIELVRPDDLDITTLRVPPGCQSLPDDPYDSLPGHYELKVVDLIADCEEYDPEGLLCWVVSHRMFASTDLEHGDIFVFRDVGWSDIAREPSRYIDVQWNSAGRGADRVLPWREFPFVIEEDTARVEPYPQCCPIHGARLDHRKADDMSLMKVLQQIDLEGWCAEQQAKFPCAGVPVSDLEWFGCTECGEAAATWMRELFDSLPELAVVQDPNGWVRCPACGYKFSLKDRNVWKNSIHMLCGQRLSVLNVE